MNSMFYFQLTLNLNLGTITITITGIIIKCNLQCYLQAKKSSQINNISFSDKILLNRPVPVAWMYMYTGPSGGRRGRGGVKRFKNSNKKNQNETFLFFFIPISLEKESSVSKK